MIVFAYGTLLDPEYQRALFDRELPTQPATLAGWAPAFTASGYLTLLRDPAATVRGALIVLGAADRAIADAWEDVPLYELMAVRAIDAAGRSIDCAAYVCPHAVERAPDGVLTRSERAAVLAAIRAFRAGGGGHTAARDA